ncbi:MAG: sugar transferase [Desulfobacter postgatei]|uniref:sugar transferase n=1 Tax=Desulfobacter postgatei TaxID=2293 RepID=UPI00030CB566|nr:sugar transferase [Desulfobacter postgatei]MDD4275138.1 sugar transferase [Desulfobacter postgatei]
MLLIKAFMDYGLALVFLALFSPLFLLIALAIVVISPGPVFYRQKRLGQGGRVR